MRKTLLSAAVALSALTAAAPAAAQWYPGAPPPPPPPAYGYGYGQPYGGYNNYGQHGLTRSYLMRLDQLRWHIEQLDRRDRISEREARSLRYEAGVLRQRVQQASYNGLGWRERRDVEYRLVRLERRIGIEARDHNGRPGYGNGYGDNGWVDRDRDGRPDRNDGWIDRDRDGRDDRWERRN